MIRPPRAVVDTNVLVAAVLKPDGICARLVGAGVAGLWLPVVSPQLLAELTRVLLRPKFRRWLSVSEAEEYVAGVRGIAEMVADPAAGAQDATRDPEDDYLLALARNSRAVALISGDRDLTMLTSKELPVLSPAEFIGCFIDPR